MTKEFYTLRMLTIAAFFFSSFHLNAQCDFNPTITGNALLCGQSGTLTLSTQSYDSYQWSRREWYWDPSVPNPNPWIALTNETNQTIIVSGATDILFEFKVTATLNACTEDSPLALIDGYAYGLPFMIANFEPGTYEEIDYGVFNVCNGASVVFENGYPSVYGYHTWYNCNPSIFPPDNSDPCIIQGVNGDSYTATSSGTYTFYACTEYCPDFCENLGTFIQLNFGDFSFCSLGTETPEYNELGITVYPNPTAQFIHIGKLPSGHLGDFSIVDSNGKVIRKIENFVLDTPINVSDLAVGTYVLILKVDDNVYRSKFIKK